MVAVSAGALEQAQQAKLPRFYLDFAKEKKYQDKQQTFTTPPVSVLYAIQEGLAMMREEGLEQVWERHALVGRMIRAGVEAIGLKLLAAEGHRSDTVTAVYSPAPDADGLKQLLTHLRTTYGLVLAGGQDDLQGRIFRIGHLGMIDSGDVYQILCTLEQGMADLGLQSRIGLAAPAAQAAVRQHRPTAEPAPVG